MVFILIFGLFASFQLVLLVGFVLLYYWVMFLSFSCFIVGTQFPNKTCLCWKKGHFVTSSYWFYGPLKFFLYWRCCCVLFHGVVFICFVIGFKCSSLSLWGVLQFLVVWCFCLLSVCLLFLLLLQTLDCFRFVGCCLNWDLSRFSSVAHVLGFGVVLGVVRFGCIGVDAFLPILVWLSEWQFFIFLFGPLSELDLPVNVGHARTRAWRSS